MPLTKQLTAEQQTKQRFLLAISVIIPYDSFRVTQINFHKLRTLILVLFSFMSTANKI